MAALCSVVAVIHKLCCSPLTLYCPLLSVLFHNLCIPFIVMCRSGRLGIGEWAELNTYHVELELLYILDVSFGSVAAYVYFSSKPTPSLFGEYPFLAI